MTTPLKDDDDFDGGGRRRREVHFLAAVGSLCCGDAVDEQRQSHCHHLRFFLAHGILRLQVDLRNWALALSYRKPFCRCLGRRF